MIRGARRSRRFRKCRAIEGGKAAGDEVSREETAHPTGKLHWLLRLDLPRCQGEIEGGKDVEGGKS